MILFLWTDDSMTGAVASDHIEPVTFVNWDGSTSAEDLADAAYDDMAAKEPGRRCLFFRHFADGERTNHEQIGANCVEDYFAHRRGQFDKMRSEQCDFWKTIKEKGDERWDFWTFDEEEGIGITLPGGFTEATWPERAAKIARVNNHPFLSRYSPEQLRGYTQSQIAAFSAWNTDLGRSLMWWAHNNTQIFLDTLREAAVGVYSTVLGEAPPPTNNYGDEVLNRTRYGLQTEPYHKGERTMAGMSAPYLYLNRFTPSLPPIFTGQTNAHRWLMFLYANNWMRMIRRTAPLMPWISYPSFDNIDRTGNMASSRHMIHACGAMGVTHGMLWSPPVGMGTGSVPSLATQLAHVETSLSTAPARTVEDTDVLPLYDYNATTVTIGSWSLTYSAGDWGTT
jgi:hypothetical protein